jgi:hypothetical protein
MVAIPYGRYVCTHRQARDATQCSHVAGLNCGFPAVSANPLLLLGIKTSFWDVSDEEMGHSRLGWEEVLGDC